MGKLKKVLAVLMTVCFLSAPVSAQALDCRIGSNGPFAGDNANRKIAELKKRIIEVRMMKKLAAASLSGQTALSGIDAIEIEKKVFAAFESSVEELTRPEYKPYVAMMEKGVTLLPELISSPLRVILSVVTLEDINAREKAQTIISELTVIGIPVGLPLAVLSWIPYRIAEEIEDEMPTLAILLYALTILMDAVGWYLIL